MTSFYLIFVLVVMKLRPRECVPRLNLQNSDSNTSRSLTCKNGGIVPLLFGASAHPTAFPGGRKLWVELVTPTTSPRWKEPALSWVQHKADTERTALFRWRLLRISTPWVLLPVHSGGLLFVDHYVLSNIGYVEARKVLFICVNCGLDVVRILRRTIGPGHVTRLSRRWEFGIGTRSIYIQIDVPCFCYGILHSILDNLSFLP
jgi:hypothetical protein